MPVKPELVLLFMPAAVKLPLADEAAQLQNAVGALDAHVVPQLGEV